MEETELDTIAALRSENDRLRQRVAELERERGSDDPDLSFRLPYRQIVEHFPIGIVVRRADGASIGANRLHYAATGVEPPTPETKLHNILHDEQAVEGGFAAGFLRAAQGEIVELEPKLVDVSRVGLPGAYDIKLWIDTLFFPVTDEAGARYVIETHRDVTRQQLELFERQAAEEENRRLQEEIQRTREAALRALSTPLIPIAEGVLAMPLVGDFDRDRARQVLETLLDGVVQRGARTAILDVTGVTGAGDEVAQGLVQIAKAVRLLGAEVVLTGVQPQMARVIAAIEESLHGVVVRSTLESGIDHALRARRAAGR
jgi:anti-anti-sigma regulatory factor